MAGSYVPACQTAPPPIFHVSAAQVSLPGSPAAGIEYQRQRLLPVSASNASTKPRGPISPGPAMPTITLPLTTNGACDTKYPSA